MVNKRPGADSVNNVTWRGPVQQRPEQPPSSTSLGVAPPSSMSPGADSVINAHGHQHPGQPPSSTSLGADSIVSDSTCSVQQHCSGQHPSSMSLGADSIVNVLSQQHRSGQPPSSTYVSTAPVRQKDSG